MSLSLDNQLYLRKVIQDFGVSEGQSPLAFSHEDFTGDGTTVAFTIAHTPNTLFTPLILLNSLFQGASAALISGTTLTFTTAPALNAKVEVNYSY